MVREGLLGMRVLRRACAKLRYVCPRKHSIARFAELCNMLRTTEELGRSIPLHVIPRKAKPDVGIRTLCEGEDGLPRTFGARNDRGVTIPGGVKSSDDW